MVAKITVFSRDTGQEDTEYMELPDSVAEFIAEYAAEIAPGEIVRVTLSVSFDYLATTAARLRGDRG